MMIEPVTADSLTEAAKIHSASWKESHKGFCTPEFVALHTPERQKSYLEAEIAKGNRVYLLTDHKPVGIVSVCGSLIGNLYVLPEEQNKGYGTKLLAFAVCHCEGTPFLWVLNTNHGARRLYESSGFRFTGKTIVHSDSLYEMEFRLH